MTQAGTDAGVLHQQEQKLDSFVHTVVIPGLQNKTITESMIEDPTLLMLLQVGYGINYLTI